jgi:hypothetical protein
MATETLTTTAGPGTEVDPLQESRARHESAHVRTAIEGILISGSQRNDIMLDRDVRDYMSFFTDEGLERGGAKDAKTKLEWLQQAKAKYAPMMIAQAQKYNAMLWQAIDQAQAGDGLTKQNVQHLKEALSRRSGNWTYVKAFFENSDNQNSFAAWKKNWRAVSDKIKAVRLGEKTIGRKTGLLESDAFKAASVTDRLQMLDKALGELSQTEHQHDYLHSQATSVLEDAVARRGLASSKVAAYLKHIFTKYTGAELIEFVQKTLPKHVDDWVDASDMYGSLRVQAAAQDVPALSETAFLELSYKERRTEVTSLKQKLGQNETAAKNPMLDQIQFLINDHEWTKARTLVLRARNADMHQDDRKRLFGLERLIEANGDQDAAKQKETESLKPLERYQTAAARLEQTLLAHASEPMRALFHRALSMSDPSELLRLRTINTGFYNIKWGTDHHFIDEEKLAAIRERKVADTEHVKEHGHQERGVGNIDLGQDTNDGDHSVFRQYEEGDRGPTYYHFDRDNVDNVIRDVDARMYNTTHNYWYLLAPEHTKLDQLLKWHEHGRPAVLEYMSAKRALMQTMPWTQVPPFHTISQVQNVKAYAAAQNLSLN